MASNLHFFVLVIDVFRPKGSAGTREDVSHGGTTCLREAEAASLRRRQVEARVTLKVPWPIGWEALSVLAAEPLRRPRRRSGFAPAMGRVRPLTKPDSLPSRPARQYHLQSATVPPSSNSDF